MATRRPKIGWFVGVTAVMVVSAAVLLAAAGTVARAGGPTTPQADVPTQAVTATPLAASPTQEVTATPQAGPMTGPELAEWKASHDPDPPDPPSAEVEQRIARRREAARAFYFSLYGKYYGEETAEGGMTAGSSSCADFNGDGTVMVDDILYVVKSYHTDDLTADLDGDGDVRVSDILVAVAEYHTNCQRGGITYIGRLYQQQHTYFNCGPAAVVAAMRILNFGATPSEAVAADLLNTTEAGTGWDGTADVPSEYDTGFPIPDVLNYLTEDHWYDPFHLDSAGPEDIAAFVYAMVSDMNQDHPVMGDAWEAENQVHLNGHPQNIEIFHWIAISGYEDGGAGTNYMDSATGDDDVTGIWWSPFVEGWNTNFDTADMVYILAGRGFIA